MYDQRKNQDHHESLVMSQFRYCPLIWMLRDRGVHAKISHIHGRALRIAYQDQASIFEDKLITDSSVSTVACN